MKHYKQKLFEDSQKYFDGDESISVKALQARERILNEDGGFIHVNQYFQLTKTADFLPKSHKKNHIWIKNLLFLDGQKEIKTLLAILLHPWHTMPSKKSTSKYFLKHLSESE